LGGAFGLAQTRNTLRPPPSITPILARHQTLLRHPRTGE